MPTIHKINSVCTEVLSDCENISVLVYQEPDGKFNVEDHNETLLMTCPSLAAALDEAQTYVQDQARNVVVA